MLSPMSDGELGAERGRKPGKSRKDRDKSGKRQKVKTDPAKDNLEIKQEPQEFVDSKPAQVLLRSSSPATMPVYQDHADTAIRNRRQSYEEKTTSEVTSGNQVQHGFTKGRKESSRSVSEEETGGSDNNGTPGSVEPYCQEHHMPHPTLEDLREKQYLDRLQAINTALASPHTDVHLLNSVVDLILETGNFSTDQENFQFDICNLDQGTIGKIETVLEL